MTLGAAAAALGLGVAVFLWKTRQIAGSIGVGAFPLDDSWIHMQFARNLAEGRGFAYNPGVPVSGSTAPLWTLALGGVFTVFGPHPALAKALGLVLALATAWLAGSLAELWTGRRELGLAALVVTALAGPILWGALSGMEVSLAALLVTAALVLRAREREGTAAVALGLGALARPEAILLLPLFWLSGPLTRRRALTWLGPVAACVAPWVAFNLATIGSPLPGTAVAKIEGGLLGALSGVREPLVTSLVRRPGQYTWEWIRWLWRVDALLPLLLVPGIAWLGRRTSRAAVIPACVLLAHPLAMALLAPYRGPGFQEGRYSIHLLPLAVVVAVAPLTAFTAVRVRRVAASRRIPSCCWPACWWLCRERRHAMGGRSRTSRPCRSIWRTGSRTTPPRRPGSASTTSARSPTSPVGRSSTSWGWSPRPSCRTAGKGRAACSGTWSTRAPTT